MLLQPLVENAIKYAVSAQEEGAEIALTARVVGERVRITVEDSGPGVDGPVQRDLLTLAQDRLGEPVSTGVGLANIRNRLMQAYGENHHFETRSEPGGGFSVLIEIPFETESAAEVAAEPSQTELKPPPASPVIPLEAGRPIGSNA